MTNHWWVAKGSDPDGRTHIYRRKSFDMKQKQYLTFTDDIIEAGKRWEEIDKSGHNNVNFEKFLEIETKDMKLETKLFAHITEHSAERLRLLMSPYYAAFIKAWLVKHEEN